MYKSVATHVLTIDPNFDLDIQVVQDFVLRILGPPSACQDTGRARTSPATVAIDPGRQLSWFAGGFAENLPGRNG